MENALKKKTATTHEQTADPIHGYAGKASTA